jgi:hypothetical protein
MPFVRASSLSFSKDELVVAVTYGTFGSHIGIGFHSAKEGAKLLHLASHIKLITEDFPPVLPACWIGIVVSLPASASKQLVAIIRCVSKRLPHINYGINFLAARGSFDSSGRYKAPKGSDGLTCATFVSTIFSDFRLPLIQESTWQPNPENAAWGAAICDWLRDRCKADPDHVEAVRRNINGLRVRPEEVAVAAETPFPSRPVDFVVATANAPAVMAVLDQACLTPKATIATGAYTPDDPEIKPADPALEPSIPKSLNSEP